MKHFSKIIYFIAICLFAKGALAQTYEGSAALLQELDVGTVVLTTPSSAYITGYASYTTPRIGGLTIAGYTRGNASITMSTKRLAAASGVYPYIGGTKYADYYNTTLTCENTSNTLPFRVQFGRFSGSAEIGVPNDTYYIGGTVLTGNFSNFGSYSGVCTGSVSWTFGYTSSNTVHYVGDVTMPIRIRIATSLPAINVSKTQDMNFGQVSSNQAHDVTINPNGCNISSTLPAGLLSTANARCGVFTIQNSGTSAQALTSVTLPSSVTLSKTGGGTMSLDLTSYPAVSSITSVPASSTTTVNVGGTLHVLTSNAPGTYQGNYTITVNY